MRLGIIGLGVMGQGIAELASSFGVSVHSIVRGSLHENLETQLNNRAKRFFNKNEALIKDLENTINFSPITVTKNISDLNIFEPDIVIECIDENLDKKLAVLSEVRACVHGNYVLSTNTSSISINEIMEKAHLGYDFIGIHFMNPPRMIPLVEVVVTNNTTQWAKEKTKQFLDEMQRVSVEVRDSPGFVINRLLIPMINTASYMLEADICDSEGIDKIMKIGAGHPIGPLALADLIGIDICVDILNSLYKKTENEAYKPSSLMMKMIKDGFLGRKSKQGFYKY